VRAEVWKKEQKGERRKGKGERRMEKRKMRKMRNTRREDEEKVVLTNQEDDIFGQEQRAQHRGHSDEGQRVLLQLDANAEVGGQTGDEVGEVHEGLALVDDDGVAQLADALQKSLVFVGKLLDL
jgi:hypothetical protein